MLKCKVCGFEFEAKSENRYTSRSGGRAGLFSASMSDPDERLYDTFDCPTCGCQYVAQERNSCGGPLTAYCPHCGEKMDLTNEA